MTGGGTQVPAVASFEALPASHPLRGLWNALRGRDTVLRDRCLAIPRLLQQPCVEVGARARCFALALGGLVLAGVAGTLLLGTTRDAELGNRHLWAAIGGWIGLVATVAVTRSELRAAVLLLVAATLGSVAAIATALPAIVVRFAPRGDREQGSYFAVGVALGLALGARAAIAYRRAPLDRPRRLGAAVRGAAGLVVVIAGATGAIYWFSQHTAPGEPQSNACVTAVAAAIAIGVAYHWIAPPETGTRVADEFRRLVPRTLPIAIAGPIAWWVIPRYTGAHAFPRWVDSLLVGSFAGMFTGYVVDLLERPFVGRRHGTALMTLVVVALVPALRRIAFGHTSIEGMAVAPLGALLGLAVGGTVTFLAARRPDHPVVEPDPAGLARTKQVVLLAAASPPGLPHLAQELESRAIQDAIRGCQHASEFDIQVRLATSFSDLCDQIARLAPSVVHLSGHCDGDRFYFHAAGDLPEPVPIDAIVQQFVHARSRPTAVVVNACKSERLVQGLTTVVDYAIGMTGPIDDRSALAFSWGFYQALGNGSTLAAACALGKNAIRARRLPDVDVPREHGREPGHVGDVALVPLQ